VQSDGAPIAGPADDPRGVPAVPVGTRIGRYEVRGLLGAGGMGAVYDAYDADLDRAVALKVLRAELGDVPGFADRLVHESRLTAKVAHASMIAVYDAERENDTVFHAELLYAGLFQIQGVAEGDLEAVLMIECPRYLFPFARRIIADLTAEGGYPPFMLEPIDFAGIYASRQGGGAAAAPPIGNA